jgi:hypothetical protein
MQCVNCKGCDNAALANDARIRAAKGAIPNSDKIGHTWINSSKRLSTEWSHAAVGFFSACLRPLAFVSVETGSDLDMDSVVPFPLTRLASPVPVPLQEAAAPVAPATDPPHQPRGMGDVMIDDVGLAPMPVAAPRRSGRDTRGVPGLRLGFEHEACLASSLNETRRLGQSSSPSRSYCRTSWSSWMCNRRHGERRRCLQERVSRKEQLQFSMSMKIVCT